MLARIEINELHKESHLLPIFNFSSSQRLGPQYIHFQDPQSMKIVRKNQLYKYRSLCNRTLIFAQVFHTLKDTRCNNQSRKYLANSHNFEYEKL